MTFSKNLQTISKCHCKGIHSLHMLMILPLILMSKLKSQIHTVEKTKEGWGLLKFFQGGRGSCFFAKTSSGGILFYAFFCFYLQVFPNLSRGGGSYDTSPCPTPTIYLYEHSLEMNSILRYKY
jgi:hypothetical protein